MFPRLALAQAEPPPAAATGQTEVDPPARVGRLAHISGTVSFHTGDMDHWEPATLNYPLTSGNNLWTEPSSSAAIEVGGTHVALAQSTQFDLDTLDVLMPE
jgi:hypothetical protein